MTASAKALDAQIDAMMEAAIRDGHAERIGDKIRITEAGKLHMLNLARVDLADMTSKTDAEIISAAQTVSKYSKDEAETRKARATIDMIEATQCM